MPTTETSRYRISGNNPLSGYSVLDWTARRPSGAPDLVDFFKTRSAAEYACRLLNQGNARINPHAVVGCRVEAR